MLCIWGRNLGVTMTTEMFVLPWQPWGGGVSSPVSEVSKPLLYCNFIYKSLSWQQWSKRYLLSVSLQLELQKAPTAQTQSGGAVQVKQTASLLHRLAACVTIHLSGRSHAPNNANRCHERAQFVYQAVNVCGADSLLPLLDIRGTAAQWACRPTVGMASVYSDVTNLSCCCFTDRRRRLCF